VDQVEIGVVIALISGLDQGDQEWVCG